MPRRQIKFGYLWGSNPLACMLSAFRSAGRRLLVGGGFKGVWPPILEIGWNRPFVPFFQRAWTAPGKSRKRTKKGPFSLTSSDLLKPPSLQRHLRHSNILCNECKYFEEPRKPQKSRKSQDEIFENNPWSKQPPFSALYMLSTNIWGEFYRFSRNCPHRGLTKSTEHALKRIRHSNRFELYLSSDGPYMMFKHMLSLLAGATLEMKRSCREL